MENKEEKNVADACVIRLAMKDTMLLDMETLSLKLKSSFIKSVFRFFVALEFKAFLNFDTKFSPKNPLKISMSYRCILLPANFPAYKFKIFVIFLLTNFVFPKKKLVLDAAPKRVIR